MTKTGSNDDRKTGSNAMLEKKSEVLAELLLLPSLGGTVFPTSMNQVRSWVDEARGLEKIGSPKVTNKRTSPWNADVLRRIDDQLRALRAKAKLATRSARSRLPLASQLKSVRNDLDSAKYLVGRLLSQVQQLLNEVHELRRQAESSEESRMRASETARVLGKEVVKLGAKPVRRIK